MDEHEQLTAEAEAHRAKLETTVRTAARLRTERNFCIDGLNGFLEACKLPAVHKDCGDLNCDTCKGAKIPDSEVDAAVAAISTQVMLTSHAGRLIADNMRIDPADYTPQGMARLLEIRRAAWKFQLEVIRNEAISGHEDNYIPLKDLNEFFRSIGVPAFTRKITHSFEVSLELTVFAEENDGDDSLDEDRADNLAESLREVIRKWIGDKSDDESDYDSVNVTSC